MAKVANVKDFCYLQIWKKIHIRGQVQSKPINGLVAYRQDKCQKEFKAILFLNL